MEVQEEKIEEQQHEEVEEHNGVVVNEDREYDINTSIQLDGGGVL